MQFKLIYKPKTQSVSKKTEVLIECYHLRKYKTVCTGVYIEPQFWSDDKCLVTTKHPQHSTINRMLKEKVSELEKACYNFEYSGGIFDFNALKNITSGKDKQSFCDYIADCLKNESDLEVKSIVKYKYNIEIIRGILGTLSTDKLTEMHIIKLDAAYRKEYAPSTVARLHIFTEKYIKLAVKSKILRSNPYDLVKLPKFKADSKEVMHTMAELDALEALQKLPYTHAMIRDRYLYSCYTGLRISDNLALLKSAFTDTPEGYVVDLHTIKGYGHDLIHPIGLMFDGRADTIARRWMNAHDEPTLFPAISRTHISSVLLVLAEMAEIDKHMTFHVARHTCASHLADVLQNPFLLMKLMGWADIKTAMGYVHSSPESTKKLLRLVKDDWKEKAR